MVNLAVVGALNLVILTVACVVATETENIMNLRQYKKSSTSESPIETEAAVQRQMGKNGKNRNYRAVLRQSGLYSQAAHLNKRVLSKLTKIDRLKGLSGRKKKTLKALALRSAIIKRENRKFATRSKHAGFLNKRARFFSAQKMVNHDMAITKNN
jgi:hypothetical protein